MYFKTYEAQLNPQFIPNIVRHSTMIQYTVYALSELQGVDSCNTHHMYLDPQYHVNTMSMYLNTQY